MPFYLGAKLQKQLERLALKNDKDIRNGESGGIAISF